MKCNAHDDEPSFKRHITKKDLLPVLNASECCSVHRQTDRQTDACIAKKYKYYYYYYYNPPFGTWLSLSGLIWHLFIM